MTVELEKGYTGKFIEIEQEDVIKRFFLPDMENIEGRVRSIAQEHPSISLVRIGRAVVTSKDETNELTDGLTGIPSEVNGVYMVDFCGDHPVVQSGPVRLSVAFIDYLGRTTPQHTIVEQTEHGQLSVYDFSANQNQQPSANNALPKADLAATLRAQQEKKQQQEAQAMQDKLNEKLKLTKEQPSGVIPTVTPRETNDVTETKSTMTATQSELNAAIEKARQKRESRKQEESSRSQIKRMEPNPQGKIDILLSKVEKIEHALYDGLTGDVTGEELSEWFYEHVDTLGHEKTFTILAGRLKK